MKVHITKYSQSNYFDNSYFCVGESGTMNYFVYTIKPYLRNLPNQTRFYFSYKVLNSVVYFKIFTDALRTIELCSGINTEIISGTNGKIYLINLTYDYGTVVIYKENDLITGTNMYGYFDANSVIDYITINDLPYDFISDFSEELINSNLEYLSSDYNFKLSNLTTERSNLNKTVFEFLQDNEGYCFRVVLENDNDFKVSFIDSSSIRYNLNNTNDGEMVSFTSFSAEKELRDFADSRKFFEVGYSASYFLFDTFNQLMQKFAKGFNVNLIDNVDIDTQILNVYSQYPQLNYMVSKFDKETMFSMFTELCKVFGILFKIEVENFDVSAYNVLNFKLFYRDGLEVQDIQVITEEQGSKGTNEKFNWGVKLGKIKDKTNTAQEYNLLYMSQDNRTLMYYLNDNDGNWRSIALFFTSAQPIGDYSINWIPVSTKITIEETENFYVFSDSTDYVYTEISPAMIFKLGNDVYSYDKIITTLINNRYDFLNTNLKDTKSFKIIYDNPIDITLYNQIFYDNKLWYIEKISNIDIINEQIKIEVTEL